MDPLPVTLRQLRYIVALDEARHFRRAAERCGISQPSLTAQMHAIEEALGVQLIERSRAGVSLTPVGREVVDRARTILEAVQGIADFAAEARHGLIGTIRLGTIPTLGPYLLPHVVATLHRQYPDLNLYIRESAPRDLEQELSRGHHDAILTQIPMAGADFVTQRLFREPLYLALAADHPLAGSDTVAPEDLRGQNVLSLTPRYPLHDVVSTLCKDVQATLLRDYEGTSLDALRQMVGMGMGVTLLPALYAHSEVPSRQDVVVTRLTGKPLTRSIGLIWKKSAGRAAAYRQIAEVIRDVVAATFKDVTIDG